MNTFKKTLLALTVAGLSSAAMAKSTITSASADISSEGTPATKAYTLASVEVTLKGADVTAYVVGGKVKLTFTGAFVNGVGTAAAFADGGTDTATDGAFAGGPNVATSTTLTSDAWATVPADTAAVGDIDNDTVTFAAIPLLLSSVTPGAKVEVKAEILGATGVPVASATSDTTKVAELKEQYAVKINDDAAEDGKLNGVIDVANARKSFVSKGTSDILVLEFTEIGTGANETEITVSIAGDMSQVKTVTDGTNAYKVDTLANTASFTYTTSTTPAVTTVSGSDDFPITFNTEAVADKQVEIVERSYATTVSMKYTDGDTIARTKTLTTGLASGAWSLNGDSSIIEYLPYGEGITQIVYVSNKGTVAGEITVTGFDDAGNKFGPVTLSTKAAPSSVTSIAGVLKTALMAEGFDGNGKVYLDFEINSPNGDITVYGSYNVNGDRVTVSNK